MSAMTPEFENALLLATLEKEIELHEVTKQALAAALAEVERLRLGLDHSKEAHRVLAAILVEQALPTSGPDGPIWIIKINDDGMQALMERAES